MDNSEKKFLIENIIQFVNYFRELEDKYIIDTVWDYDEINEDLQILLKDYQ